MNFSFPLLRLPQLVLAEILNSLEIGEQFLFSLCSKKAETIFKSLRNKKLTPKIVVNDEWIGHTFVEEDQTITVLPFIGFSRGSVLGKVEKVKMGRHLIEIHILKENFDSLPIRCKDDATEIKIVSDYILDLFGVGIYVLTMITKPQQLVDLFQDKQIEILSVCNYRIWADELTNILSNLTAKYLFIHHWPSIIRLDDRRHTRFDLLVVTDRIEIRHLIGFDCVEMKIKNGKFTNKELNRFLIYWINGQNARLKCFFADMADFNQQLALKGIKVQKSKDSTRIYKSLSGDLEFENIEIQRKDGTIASIKYFRESKSFSFAVWPDNDDTPNRSILVKTVDTFISALDEF